MGTTSEVIIENGTKTESFYVNFGSQEDDLGKELKNILDNINCNNWKYKLVKELKNNNRFKITNKLYPVNYVYLINHNKQILYKNNRGWQKID